MRPCPVPVLQLARTLAWPRRCPSYDDRECPLPITDPRTSCVQDISDDVVGMPLVRLSLSDLSGQQPGHPCVAKDTNGN